MAHEEPAGDAIDDLKYFAFILLCLAIIWYLSGGYDRYKASHGGNATSTATSTLYIVR